MKLRTEAKSLRIEWQTDVDLSMYVGMIHLEYGEQSGAVLSGICETIHVITLYMS